MSRAVCGGDMLLIHPARRGRIPGVTWQDGCTGKAVSQWLGLPSGCPPVAPVEGISSPRTADFERLSGLPARSASNAAIACPAAPAVPWLAFTFLKASQTSRFGMSNGFAEVIQLPVFAFIPSYLRAFAYPLAAAPVRTQPTRTHITTGPTDPCPGQAVDTLRRHDAVERRTDTQPLFRRASARTCACTAARSFGSTVNRSSRASSPARRGGTGGAWPVARATASGNFPG